MPSLTKDLFGLKDFGSNYGLMFSAWGVGGFVFPRLAQTMVAQSGTLDRAYIMTAALLVFCSIMAFYSRSKADTKIARPAPQLGSPLIELYSEN